MPNTRWFIAPLAMYQWEIYVMTQWTMRFALLAFYSGFVWKTSGKLHQTYSTCFRKVLKRLRIATVCTKFSADFDWPYKCAPRWQIPSGRHRSDTIASDRCLTEVDPMVFANWAWTWAPRPLQSFWWHFLANAIPDFQYNFGKWIQFSKRLL